MAKIIRIDVELRQAGSVVNQYKALELDMKINGMAVTILCLSAGSAYAVTDKFNISAAEHVACDRDAIDLCGDTARDEDQLLVCMKRNSSRLSPSCRVAFDAGLKKRHLSF